MTESLSESLSAREIEILRLAAEGRANAEIAAHLSLSLNTVKWYSKRIYEKLDVESRAQAIRQAHTLGLLNRTLSQARPTPSHAKLPNPLTDFLGRRSEVDAVKQLVKHHRLVTLTGPGGIGKTRLAIQVATEIKGQFEDGAHFIDLASINESALVINTIAHMLGVAESLDTPLLTLTQATLQDKQMLLILDNFEHLLDAAPLVAELLAAARNLSVLITSREVLALYGEQEYAVPPLNLPDLEWFAMSHLAPTPMLNSEALQLFERCAQAVYPDFRCTPENLPAIASICLRLDGLPLAIELAAAYVKVLTPQTMLMQLDSMWLEMNRSLRNVPARHQTLRNTIEWSYRFLNAGERRLFAQLAVFRGGCNFEVIDAICDHESPAELLHLLNGLVNKSLVWRREDSNAQPRFGMLETIREYALTCLRERGELATMQERHAIYYTGYIYRVEMHLATVNQRLVLNQLEVEVDNFRAALRWALKHDPEPGLRMIGDLASCWRVRGYLTEGMSWAQQLLAAPAQTSAAIQARAYANISLLALTLGHHAQARQMADQAYHLSQQAADPQTRGQALYASIYARLLPNMMARDYEEIANLANEAELIYTQIQSRPGHGRVCNLLGEINRLQGRYEEAQRFYEMSLNELRSEGYLSDTVAVHSSLGWTALHRGNLERAFAHFIECLNLSKALDFLYGITMSLLGIAGVWARMERAEAAAQLVGAATAIHESLGGDLIASNEPEYEATTIELRARLKALDYDRHWQAGRMLTVAEAIALAETDQVPPAQTANRAKSQRGLGSIPAAMST